METSNYVMPQTKTPSNQKDELVGIEKSVLYTFTDSLRKSLPKSNPVFSWDIIQKRQKNPNNWEPYFEI